MRLTDPLIFPKICWKGRGQLGGYPLIATDGSEQLLYFDLYWVIKSKLKSLLSGTFWKTTVETNRRKGSLQKFDYRPRKVKIFIFLIFTEILEFLQKISIGTSKAKNIGSTFFIRAENPYCSSMFQKEPVIFYPIKICWYFHFLYTVFFEQNPVQILFGFC